MSHGTVNDRYFVLHLNDRDRPGADSQLSFQIQLLDDLGRSVEEGYVGLEETELRIADRAVPRAVLDAARRQPLGQGDYVDANGESVSPSAR